MPWLDLWFIKQNLSNLVVRLNLTWHAIIAFAHDVDVSKVLSLVRSQFHQTFYEQICIQKRICVIFWQKYIGTKGTHKMLVKLTTGGSLLLSRMSGFRLQSLSLLRKQNWLCQNADGKLNPDGVQSWLAFKTASFGVQDCLTRGEKIHFNSTRKDKRLMSESKQESK